MEIQQKIETEKIKFMNKTQLTEELSSIIDHHKLIASSAKEVV